MGTAWAQTSEPAGPPAIYQFGLLGALLAIFLFVLVLPERRRQREHRKLLAELKRNDQVVLNSGLHGRVVGLAEKVVTIEIAPKVPVQVERDAIQQVLTAPGPEARDKEREKS